MSSTVPTKTSATTAVPSKMSVAASVAASARRLTLNQATRAHLDASLGAGKRKTTAKPFSNANPQALTGLLGLSTCNSGFLNNLLADVAQAKQDILRAQGKDVSLSPSVKRRRISMPDSADINVSPVPVQQTNKPLKLNPKQPSSFLDLLWEESWLAPPAFGGVNVRLNPRPVPARAVPVMPPPPVAPRATLIPATVSETFPQQEEADVKTATTKSTSGPTKMETEDSFGWYIDMDEDDDYPQNSSESDDSHRFSPYATKGSTDTLAFSAPTAPKASNHDAEVEWAKAADTVDDVLGDLF